jgi:lysozyme
MPRHINAAGLKLLMASEGCRLTAYPDPGSGGDPWTIGYGAVGPGIEKGVTWTQDQCNKRLLQDIARFEKGVDELVKHPISENAFSSLVCFAYNVGLENFRRSTMLKLTNQGSVVEASRQFPLWVRANGRVMPGLVMRRKAEAGLFMKPDRG